MRVRCIAVYTAKVPIDHVASFAKGPSQMQMSVAIGLCGNPKTALGISWGRTVYFPVLLYIGHALRHGPPELYSYTSLYIAIQRYTLYTAIHYTTLQHPSVDAPGSGLLSPGLWPAQGRPGVGTHVGSPWPQHDIHYESPPRGFPTLPPNRASPLCLYDSTCDSFSGAVRSKWKCRCKVQRCKVCTGVCVSIRQTTSLIVRGLGRAFLCLSVCLSVSVCTLDILESSP